ncbi:MAG: transcriptional regulator ExuR [Roseovarius sp.]
MRPETPPGIPADTSPETPPPKPGAAEIAALLRRAIASGKYMLHDRLPAERTLAETYGVARGTVREALNRLAREGRVEIRPGSGTYVTQGSDDDHRSVIATANPLELMDARFAIEPHACRLAVLHGLRSDFTRLATLCDRMDKSVGQPAAFAEADAEFHRGLAACTRNRLLMWIMDQITSIRDQEEWMLMRELTLNDDIIRTYNVQHRQILNAIRSREPERAATLMKQHLETARLSLTRAVQT